MIRDAASNLRVVVHHSRWRDSIVSAIESNSMETLEKAREVVMVHREPFENALKVVATAYELKEHLRESFYHIVAANT